MKFNKVLISFMIIFLLGTHNGYIALWKEGSEQPIKVFPYRAEMLPPADQKALSKGIRIDSDHLLAAYLEDYLS